MDKSIAYLSPQEVTDRLFDRVRRMTLEEKRQLLETLESGQPGKKERLHMRTLCCANVHFSFRENRYTGSIQDISRSGLFIETEDSFAVGQQITLSLPSDDSDAPSTLMGKVVRTDVRGIGIKINPEDYNSFGKFGNTVRDGLKG